MTQPDLQFCNHGFAVTVQAVTDKGMDWLAENIIDGELPGFIEPRYLADIVEGARADGLVCHG